MVTPADNHKQFGGYPQMKSQARDLPHVIGCDVGKDEIVVFDSHSETTWSVPNKAADLKRFAAKLPQGCLVVCEATGNYEAALLEALVAAGCRAHRADARKVKAFIRSLGTLAKTDAVDAKGLARYGQERYDRLSLWQAPDQARLMLQALTRYCAKLVGQRAALKNHLQAPGAERIKSHIEAMIALLTGQVEILETEIKQLVKNEPDLAGTVKLIMKIPGCGHLTAVAVVALMPELGTLSRRQAASLAGLAPHPVSSGKHDGYRRTRGGRPEVKRALFMAALTASRFHPELSIFYQRLLTKGKKPIVATVAVMRKLIVMINGKIRDERAKIICAN